MHHILKNKKLTWKARTVMDIINKPNNWPNTKYLEKAEKKNRKSYYFKLFKE